MWYYKCKIEESEELNIGYQVELQGLRRKLAYLSNAYNQTFNALRNCIVQYQEKVIGITDQGENEKEDPYSILSQSEIQLRRALHEFYTFLENEDPYAQSQTK